MKRSVICSIEGCEKTAKARGWCNAHWRRWRRYGDPLASRHASPGAPLQWIDNTAITYHGEDCLDWPFGKSEGYGRVYVEGKYTHAHRLICRMVHGTPPSEDWDAAHSCGNGHLGCVNRAHLSWKPRSKNLEDKLLHGTHNRGERHFAAKLTEADVAIIRASSGIISQRGIAQRFGISQQTVSGIVTRRSWRWLL